MNPVRRLRNFISMLLMALVLFGSLDSAVAQSGGLCRAAHGIVTSVEVDPQLLSEIARLPEHGSIPENIFLNYKVNDIGRAIVSRIQGQEAQHSHLFLDPKKHAPINFAKDAEIIIFFQHHNTQSIRTKGFLNQHLTRSSRGTYDPARRSQTEDEYTGLRLGSGRESLILRPKSAFLNVKTPVILDPKSLAPNYYGEIGAILKESVWDRATWTSGDSLNQHQGREAIPNRLLNRGTFGRQSLPMFSRDHLYYEAQIYGEIDFNDVEAFLVPDRSYVSLLSDLNKPIYIAQQRHSYQRHIYEKGDLLFSSVKVELPTPPPPAPAPIEVKPVAKPEVKESPKIETADGRDVFAQILKISGISDEIETIERKVLVRDEFEMSRVVTKTREFFISTPRDSAETIFQDYMSELQSSLILLESHGFSTLRILQMTDAFVVQEVSGRLKELSTLSELEKRTVLPALMSLISKLIQNKLYIKGLRPSMLLMTPDGQLVIRSNDGVRESKSKSKALDRFEEKLLQHWNKFLDESSVNQLEGYLKRLRLAIPKERAA